MKKKRQFPVQLPDYLRGEEIMNMVTHIAGGAFGILALILSVCRAAISGDPAAVATCAVYGTSMIAVYATSSIYHGLSVGRAKCVLRVLDHCMIYLLIAGTYTPITLCAIAPVDPVLGWGLFSFQWGLAALAITLTAIDMKKYKVFSMVCYIFMGWCILFFIPQAVAAMTDAGFLLTLLGGIAYSVGAILYGIGKKKRWMHSVFHIFVVLGSIFQFFVIYLYVI